jgi:diketogulonate reductase-like aldo/keto reductase
MSALFQLRPADGVDPNSVPQLTLHTGAKIPCIGQGTFGNDRFTPAQIAESVLGGLSVGYRFIDCAAVYGSEREIGEVLEHVLKNGVAREELFISSKLWNDRHAPVDVLPTLKKSLADLRLDYLDMYFIHWPFPNTHAPGAAHDSRSPDAKPYIHANYMATYRELEKAVDAGLIRHTGTSNMTRPKMELVLADARIKPAANQMEMHPTFQQTEFFTYLRTNGVLPIAFCPIGSPGRPPRDTDPSDVEVLTHPTVVSIAEAHGVHPALVAVKWAAQRGQLPIPSSIHREKYLSSLKAVVSDPLTADEMERMAAVDCGSRLIKGQVFLWEKANSWHDLWDIGGVIAT